MTQALPQYQSGAPAVLNDSALIDLTNLNGPTVQLSSQKLSNVYGCPIAVKEIRFFVQTDPIATGISDTGLLNPYDFGQILTAFVSVNNVNLMQNPVHLRSLGTFLQSDLTYGIQAALIQRSPARYYEYASTFFRWIFARPLFIPRNASFDIRIGLDHADATNNIPPFIPAAFTQAKIDVAVVGTLQPDLQGMMAPYPYVAEFAPPGLCPQSASGKPAFAMGNDPIFRNVFANPLLLSRIVASLYQNTVNSTLGNVDVLPMFPDAVLARLWDSKGNNIAGYAGGNAIPMGLLVDPRDGNWFIERQLDQYEWLNVELATPGYTNLDNSVIMYPRVAVHGEHMQLFTP